MKRRHDQEWTARLSGYLSDELSSADKLAVEAHLSSCDDCNAALRDLARVVAEAGGLGDIEPRRDLWPGIAEAIASNGNDPRVIAFPGSRPANAASAPGRVELSRRGLIAASVALIALSGTAAWFAGRSTTVADVPSAAAPLAPGSGAVSPVAGDQAAPVAMAGELAILEDVLTSARSVLDPNTVRVLERNLGVIEQAIADSREALAQDPGNTFLAQHLERMYRRKLVYLQDAVRLVEFGG
jgi:anti-sigma factor RsiW